MLPSERFIYLCYAETIYKQKQSLICILSFLKYFLIFLLYDYIIFQGQETGKNTPSVLQINCDYL